MVVTSVGEPTDNARTRSKSPAVLRSVSFARTVYRQRDLPFATRARPARQACGAVRAGGADGRTVISLIHMVIHRPPLPPRAGLRR